MQISDASSQYTITICKNSKEVKVNPTAIIYDLPDYRGIYHMHVHVTVLNTIRQFWEYYNWKLLHGIAADEVPPNHTQELTQ